MNNMVEKKSWVYEHFDGFDGDYSYFFSGDFNGDKKNGDFPWDFSMGFFQPLIASVR